MKRGSVNCDRPPIAIELLIVRIMQDMITAPTLPDAPWLSRRLSKNGSQMLSWCAVTESRKTDSGRIYFVNARGSSSGPFVLKVYDRTRFQEGLNEALFYGELYRAQHLSVAAECYDLLVVPSESYCHILTADLREEYRIPDRIWKPEEWVTVLRSLAILHAHWWDHDRLLEADLQIPHGGPMRMIQVLPLESIRRNCLWMLGDVIPRFCDMYSGFLPRAWINEFEVVTAAWPNLYNSRIKSGRNLTLIHGDCHWENTFIPCRSYQDHARLIDWESQKRGLAAFDVSYMTISARSVEHRRQIEPAIIKDYLELLQRFGVYISREQFEYDYRLSIIANLFVAILWGRLNALNDAMSACFDWKVFDLVDR